MGGLKEVFSIYDKFKKNFDSFNKSYDQATKSFEQSEKAAQNVSKNEDKVETSSKNAAKSIGSAGLGGAFLVLNQAMQFFERISAKVMKNLEDIGDKQRSFILLGKGAGAELNEFARQAASSMGRAEAEIRNAGQRWSKLGIGGTNIKELTRLADRFANLNPGKEYKDVAESFADAIKSRNANGLADLLGGGELIEQKIERKHIERYLKQGNISKALEQFKSLADEMGYTQEKADELGMTFDRKVQRITERVKNYITDMVSDVVSIAEPYVDKFIDWLNDDKVQGFFQGMKEEVTMAAAAASALVDTIITGWEELAKISQPIFEAISEITDNLFTELENDSLGVVDTIVGIFVGGVSQIVLGAVEIVQHGLNIIITGIETDANFILGICEDIANGAIHIANWIKNGIIDIVSELVIWIGGLIDDLSGTDLGELLGITSAADSIHQITEDLQKAKENNFGDISLKRINLDEYKVDPIDSVKFTSEAIDGAIEKVHGFFNRSIDAQTKANLSVTDSLDDLNDGVGKLVGMGKKEQDLRWLKEMAEQRFINEINLRQLTPTINLQVKGTSNQTPNQYAKSLAYELQKMADAGTFNAYGNVG